MSTIKLYYEDSFLREFTATVTGCEETKKGFAVTLDATVFYPEGGGQPYDTGILGDARVLEVRERGEEVIHYCDKALSVGSTVTGRIDWERRFDFMQQHSGEHIISGLIHKKMGYHNVGFHLGNDVVTIDFDGPLSLDALLQIEEEANRYIWQNKEVRCWYPSPEELPQVNYRRKKDLPWPVRIVEFPGADICACCGTQVTHTGQVGLVKILSCIKFHDGIRVEMLSGKRAMRHLAAVYEQNRLVSQTFSAKIPETGIAAQRINAQLSTEKLRAVGLQKRLFRFIARDYEGQTLALHFEEDLTSAAVRELADAIGEKAGIAVVCSGSDDTAYSLCIISQGEDVRALGKAAADALHGRGGGKPNAFQGNFKATRKEIEEFFSKS